MKPFGLLFALAAAAWGQSFAASPALDEAIEKAIHEEQIPGAVLWVGHQGQIVHRKAYGMRSLTPAAESMTVDTIFDCASLTKVVATTTSIARLLERGQIRLNAPVTDYLPEFQGGKSDVTVRHLLTHFSGMRPDLDLKPEWSGYETGIRLASADKPRAAPGTRFVYSDINFILLGEIVRRVGGRSLDDFAREEVFVPLGMTESTFRPPESWRPRIAPTESVPKGAPPLRGVVHDETTRYMGGVAGHAGLFSTAGDLAKFAEMMLGEGTRNGVHILSPLTVGKITSPQSPADQPVLRGLGWDIDSPFSGNRGELFPIGSYGHTGFTGTSLWIDPASQTYVILLTNSVHPFRRPPVTPLRARIATLVAAAVGITAPGVRIGGYNESMAGVRREVARNAQTLTGLDVLVEENFARLRGKRVGLITNHTGLDREARRNVDLMVDAGVEVAALFSPEHGIFGKEDHENVGNTTVRAGASQRLVRVLSLFEGERRRPTPEMLKGLDVLVFDIQDVGCRFYTYISTMGYVLEEAAAQRIPLLILDRPNPITGVRVEGPVADPDLLSFVGYFPMPLRHGMTAGEMARMFNAEKRIGADLQVVAMKNWQRGDWFDSTGLAWVNPSPNMRSLNAALLYPGIGMIESSQNWSVGRGTETPFEVVGANFVRGRELAAVLNQRQIPGIRVYPVRFQPTASNYAGKTIEGVRLVITHRELVNSVRTGLEVAAAVRKLYPGRIDFALNEKLIGSRALVRALGAGEDARTIEGNLEEPLAAFLAVRARYLLY